MAAADHLPSVQDVADLVRARTRDDLGQEIGTFDETTRPTADSVGRLIASEASIVLLRTGPLDALACPNAADVRKGAANVIAKRVAAIVEASYRPDEVAEGRTVADFYQGSQEDDLEALATAAATCAAWTPEPGDDENPAGAAVAYFPPPTIYGRW